MVLAIGKAAAMERFNLQMQSQGEAQLLPHKKTH